MNVLSPIGTPDYALFTLWQRLDEELATTFDAHGVCAAIASEVAQSTQTTTVVGLSNPQQGYFDVWVGRPNKRLEQTRWENKKASFPGLLAEGAAANITKLAQPAAEVIQSELWRHPRIPALRTLTLPLQTAYPHRPIHPLPG